MSRDEAEARRLDSEDPLGHLRERFHIPFVPGTERESIYLRIAVGMRGTAHPAVPGLPQEQLTDLVEYVLSLARQPYCVLTNYDRRVRADARAYRERLGR